MNVVVHYDCRLVLSPEKMFHHHQRSIKIQGKIAGKSTEKGHFWQKKKLCLSSPKGTQFADSGIFLNYIIFVVRPPTLGSWASEWQEPQKCGVQKTCVNTKHLEFYHSLGCGCLANASPNFFLQVIPDRVKGSQPSSQFAWQRTLTARPT